MGIFAFRKKSLSKKGFLFVLLFAQALYRIWREEGLKLPQKQNKKSAFMVERRQLCKAET